MGLHDRGRARTALQSAYYELSVEYEFQERNCVYCEQGFITLGFIVLTWLHEWFCLRKCNCYLLLADNHSSYTKIQGYMMSWEPALKPLTTCYTNTHSVKSIINCYTPYLILVTLKNNMSGLSLRAAIHNTCYSWVYFIGLWCYWWNCLLLMEITHKVTSLLWLWELRVKVTPNLMKDTSNCKTQWSRFLFDF